MYNYKILFVVIGIIFLIGCGGGGSNKISVEKLELMGQVYDSNTGDPIEGVDITLNGSKGWSCNEISDEDGDYIINDECIKLKNRVETLNSNKLEKKLEFTILFDHDIESKKYFKFFHMCDCVKKGAVRTLYPDKSARFEELRDRPLGTSRPSVPR